MVLVWLFSWAGTDKEEDIFQPMTVFTAARESRGVTLSGDDGTMWELDNGQAEVALSQRGIQVDEQVVDYRKTVSVEKQTLTIPRGRNFYVLLSDGTEVWLNAESRLSYPSRFDEDERIVELEGEAYFKVASDKAHPFIVRTSRFNTRVLGTEFNVKAHQDDTPYVTLVSGSVRIKASRSGEEVSLHPGQEFSINAEDKIELKEVDPYYCTDSFISTGHRLRKSCTNSDGGIMLISNWIATVRCLIITCITWPTNKKIYRNRWLN
jgi:transmembrane sensor